MEKYWHENCESWLIYMSHFNTSWPTLQHLNSAVMKCTWGTVTNWNNQTVLQCMNHTILLLVKYHFHITTLHKYSFFVFYFYSSYICCYGTIPIFFLCFFRFDIPTSFFIFQNVFLNYTLYNITNHGDSCLLDFSPPFWKQHLRIGSRFIL